MKKIATQPLLDQLRTDTELLIAQAEKLRAFPDPVLQTQPADGGWSVIQVLHHLNFYGNHYVNAMERVLSAHNTQAKDHYTPGWFGDYFVRILSPATSEKGITRLPAPPSGRPPKPGKLHLTKELDTFVQYQQTILRLLQQAQQADLDRLRVPIAIAGWLIKLKLGDTFRFVIGHEQRHFQQIDRVLQEVAAQSVISN